MCVRFVVVCMEILSVGMEGKQKVLDRKGAVLHPGMDGRIFFKKWGSNNKTNERFPVIAGEQV